MDLYDDQVINVLGEGLVQWHRPRTRTGIGARADDGLNTDLMGYTVPLFSILILLFIFLKNFYVPPLFDEEVIAVSM